MKKQRRGSIMVAVRSLDRASSRLLRKAASLATAQGCKLELVHVISLPYVPGIGRQASVREAAQQIVEDRKRSLLELSTSPALRGLRTSASILWDFPAADGLVRHVLKRRPKMLIAESQRHSRLARPFLTNTDWELIRKCPCPVWLSKSARSRPDGAVLAALDPLHAHAKPAALDGLILQHALQVAQGRRARVFACHAYSLPAPVPVTDGIVEAYWIGMSDEEIERYKSMVGERLTRLAAAHEISAKNTLLVQGDPASALPRLAKKHRASVVVMGAVSRSALARIFIGQTAERVIDALDCDVLIVKPRGFRTNVSLRPSPVPSTAQNLLAA